MAELNLKLEEYTGRFSSSLSYEHNRIFLKLHASKDSAEVSKFISEIYMEGGLLKGFSMQKCKNGVSVSLEKSSIDKVKCKGNLYELQLNRVKLEYTNEEHMNNGIIINLPPEQIEGLTKESKQITIKAFGSEITFGYNDDTTTCIVCPDTVREILVSLISLYYCFPIEILQEFKNKDTNNQMEVTLRSQRRTFEDIGSRVNLYCKADNVIKFLQTANTEHPHIKDLPRYVRQFIDSFVVSEPQRFSMLFAMASSFAEYILEKGKQGGGNLVGETISHFNIEGLEKIKDTIRQAELTRNENKISTLADLRNECEHNLYSEASYEFFDNNPSVNVFMYDMACKIVMELAGVNIE